MDVMRMPRQCCSVVPQHWVLGAHVHTLVCGEFMVEKNGKAVQVHHKQQHSPSSHPSHPMLNNVLCSFLRMGRRREPTKGFYGMMSRKRGNKHYYKGFGNSNLGNFTRKGTYQLDADKLPEYIVPDLKGFALRPYVENSAAAESKFREFYKARKAVNTAVESSST